MFNEGNQIHNLISSSGSGTVINYGSGSDFLTSYGSGYGSGSTSQKVTVPVPVPQHCSEYGHRLPAILSEVSIYIIVDDQTFCHRFLSFIFLSTPNIHTI